MPTEPEEQLIMNYLDAEFINETDALADKQDDSFDENQNPGSKKPYSKKAVQRQEPANLGNNEQNNNGRRRSPRHATRKSNETLQVPSPTDIEVNGVTVGDNEETKVLQPKEAEKPSLNGSREFQTVTESITIKIENFDDEVGPVNETGSANIAKKISSQCENVVIKTEKEDSQPNNSSLKPDSDSNSGVSPKSQKKQIKNFLNSLDKLSGLLEPKVFGTLYKVVDLEPKCKISQNVFKCSKCLYVGNSKANLERHSLIHMDPSEILWFKCSDCEYKSKYESQLKSHMLVHKTADEIEYFQCPHCDLRCTRKHNLNNHIRTIHTDRVNNLKCAQCSYMTFSKDRLVAHVKMHSTEVFTCHLCKFVTKNKEYLNNHFKLKHTDVKKPFPCDTCSYKGKTKRELMRHYNRMHNKEQLKSFQCNHCNFNSIYKKNLEFHLLHMHQNSEGFQKFICGHCDKEFAYKNGLKTHIIRMHLKLTEEDWHKCQECNYKSKDVNTLKRHIKRNHGAPRLLCKECNFTTNRQKSLIAHLKTHQVADGQILKCPECPYRIIQTVSFFYHMKAIHGKPISNKDVHQFYLKRKSPERKSVPSS